MDEETSKGEHERDEGLLGVSEEAARLQSGVHVERHDEDDDR